MGEVVFYLIVVLWLIGGWYFTRGVKGTYKHRPREDLALASYVLLTVMVLGIVCLISLKLK